MKCNSRGVEDKEQTAFIFLWEKQFGLKKKGRLDDFRLFSQALILVAINTLVLENLPFQLDTL